MIETVSVLATVPDGQRIVYVGIGATVNGSFVNYFIPATFGGNDTYIASQVLRLYDDGGSDVIVHVERDSTADRGGAQINLSGYLLDCSVAACQ